MSFILHIYCFKKCTLCWSDIIVALDIRLPLKKNLWKFLKSHWISLYKICTNYYVFIVLVYRWFFLTMFKGHSKSQSPLRNINFKILLHISKNYYFPSWGRKRKKKKSFFDSFLKWLSTDRLKTFNCDRLQLYDIFLIK